MKRIISYIFMYCLLWAGCTSTTEGLAPDKVITVSNNKIEMESKGGKTSIKVDSYCDWQVTSDEEWQWISVSNKSGKKGITTLDITLKENIATSKRNAVLTVANQRYGVSQQINITQNSGDPFINISENRYEVSSTGASNSIEIESNTTWTASCVADWITLSPTNGDGTSTLQITIKPNTDTNTREATVQVANKEYKITKEIAIKQAAFTPQITVDKSSLEFSCIEQEKSLTVDANISWSASCNANWITISPQSGKEGKSTIKITVEQNTNTTSRSTTLKIYNSNYNINKEVTITQTHGTILEISFTSGLGDFTAYSVKGSETWHSENDYGATMSGYNYNNSANYANEDWLISPALNLTGMSGITINFEHTINKGDLDNLTTNHTMWISTNYTSGNPNNATWEEIEIVTYPNGNSWKFVSSGAITIPQSYMQENVRFAFKYLCSDTESATWEIKNLVVK